MGGGAKSPKKINAPVLLLAAFRKVEEREVTNVRWSRTCSIWRDRGCGLTRVPGIYRDVSTTTCSSLRKGTAELGILKQRDGATGVE